MNNTAIVFPIQFHTLDVTHVERIDEQKECVCPMNKFLTIPNKRIKCYLIFIALMAILLLFDILGYGNVDKLSSRSIQRDTHCTVDESFSFRGISEIDFNAVVVF